MKNFLKSQHIDIDFQPFLSWLKSEGVVLDKIELLKSPNYGNGVFAVRNIKVRLISL